MNAPSVHGESILKSGEERGVVGVGVCVRNLQPTVTGGPSAKRSYSWGRTIGMALFGLMCVSYGVIFVVSVFVPT